MLDVGAKYFDTDKDGLNVGYLFSTSKALSSFSKQRFSNLIGESQHLANLFTEYDSVFFKKAGKSSMNMAGGKSVPDMLSFDADLLILDEFDRILSNIIALAEARLADSDLGYKFTLSTPTIPDEGIDALYLESDQKVWEVQCASCGRYQELDFWRDVCADGEHYGTWKKWNKERLAAASMHIACPSCQEPINTFGPGRWTALKPEIKRISGYNVPPLSTGKLNLNKLAQMAVSTDPEVIQQFHNSFLGLAHQPKGSRVTKEMLKQLSSQIPDGMMESGAWNNTTMGVDVNYPRYNYRISSTGPDGKRYVRAMGYVVGEKGKNGYAKLSELLVRYKVRHCVIDNGPEYNPTAEWAAKHPGIVLRGYYPTTATALKGLLFKLPSEEPDDADESEKQEANQVKINRTMAMDKVFNNLAEGDERWPAEFHDDEEIAAHMMAPVRELIPNKDGQLEPRWRHTKPDDYYHTCVYDTIALLTLPKVVVSPMMMGGVKGWGN